MFVIVSVTPKSQGAEKGKEEKLEGERKMGRNLVNVSCLAREIQLEK